MAIEERRSSPWELLKQRLDWKWCQTKLIYYLGLFINYVIHLGGVGVSQKMTVNMTTVLEGWDTINVDKNIPEDDICWQAGGDGITNDDVIYEHPLMSQQIQVDLFFWF